MSSKDKTKKVASICDRLSKKFRVQPFPEDMPSVEALLIAVLMEKIPPSRAEQAVKRLQGAFVDWNEMRVTRGREIIEWAKEKHIDQRTARACRDALDRLYADRSDFDLSFLADESFDTMRNYLVNGLRLPLRPAARLMLLYFGRPALPVADDVRRVADRLGLVDPSWPENRAQKSLVRLIPCDRMAEFYHYSAQHAEATCLVASPKCARCLLRTICDYYAETSKKKPSAKKSTSKKTRKKTTKKTPKKRNRSKTRSKKKKT